jgi:hypothetical protein
MGKASSSKKVARAAGIGGRGYRRRTPWSYFGIIVLIVVLGVGGTVFSRHQRDQQIAAAGTQGALTVGTLNYEAYAVYECGKFVAPVKTPAPDPDGITAWTPSGVRPATDGGVIEIAPTSKTVAGKNATLGKFAQAVGMKLNAAELQTPGGHLYQAGDTCEGKPGYVYVAQFANAQQSVGGKVSKLNPVDIPLKAGGIITIAFVPASDQSKIPAPNPDVDTELTAAESQQAGTTTTPTTASTPSTAPPATAVAPPATAPAASSPTTAAAPPASG